MFLFLVKILEGSIIFKKNKIIKMYFPLTLFFFFFWLVPELGKCPLSCTLKARDYAELTL